MKQKNTTFAEGWSGDQYYTLFEGADHDAITQAYGVDKLLPGYIVVGLVGWDDFLLVKDGEYFTSPTIPAVAEYVVPFSSNDLPTSLESDPPRVGTVKWYV